MVLISELLRKFSSAFRWFQMVSGESLFQKLSVFDTPICDKFVSTFFVVVVFLFFCCCVFSFLSTIRFTKKHKNRNC